MIKLWTTEKEERAKRPIPYEYQIRGILKAPSKTKK